MSNNIHLFRVFNKPLSEITAACMRSVIRHNMNNVIVWLNTKNDLSYYDQHTDILLHANLKFVDEEFPEYFMHAKDALNLLSNASNYIGGNALAMYSDIIRIQILLKYGGWWLDDDIFMLKSISDFNIKNSFMCGSEINWCSSFAHPFIPSNFVLYNDNSHVLNAYAAHIQNVALHKTNKSYTEFGPLALRHLYNERNIDSSNLIDIHLFYAPFNINRSLYLDRISLQSIVPLSNCYGLHITGLTNNFTNDSVIAFLMLLNSSICAIDTTDYVFLLNKLKYANSRFYEFVHKFKKENTYDVLNWSELYQQYVGYEKA